MPVSRKRKTKKGKTKRQEIAKRPPSTPANMAVDLIERMKLSKMFEGQKIKKGHFEFKISELILEYGGYYLSTCETESEFRGTIPFIIMCWNIGNLTEESERQETINILLAELGGKEMEADIIKLVAKKMAYYDEYKFHVSEFDITKLADGGLHLSVAALKLDA